MTLTSRRAHDSNFGERAKVLAGAQLPLSDGHRGHVVVMEQGLVPGGDEIGLVRGTRED
jgi:hypothetical protein